MYVYDRARALAEDIRQSDAYKAYKALKDEVYADESAKGLIRQYKKLQFEAQASMMTGQQPDAALMEKLGKTGEVLGFNPKVTEFFAAEYKFQTMISDIYKIIGDACELDMAFLDS